MKQLADGSFVSDDTPTKNISGLRYLLTADEIVEQNQRAAAEMEARPMREWSAKISATDSNIPRALEDIIDALDAATKSRISEVTINHYSEKKRIRNEKPKD